MRVAGVLLLVVLTSLLGHSCARVREHFIAADEVEWNYAPSGMNLLKGVPLEDDPVSAIFFEEGGYNIGGTYVKAIYREYTDASFSERRDRGDEWEHLGLVGPPLFAEVGDTLRVHFKNNARFRFSMTAMGLSYNKDNEGTNYPYDGPDGDGDFVEPGDVYTYNWDVPGSSGPGEGDWSSTVYIYTSGVRPIQDQYSGLVGPIVVTANGMADSDGRPLDVDRELFLFMSEISETTSPYFDVNIQRYLNETPPVSVLTSPAFVRSNLMHSINGYVFNNLPGLSCNQYERVRWYVISLGSVKDLHTPGWNGQTLLDRGLHRVGAVFVYPQAVEVLDMVPDRAGSWQYHCLTNEDNIFGMTARYEVLPASNSESIDPATTRDIGSFIFSDAEVAEDSDDDSSSSEVTNPFSSATLTATPALFLGLAVAMMVAL